jgi:pyruvate,water dikinase
MGTPEEENDEILFLAEVVTSHLAGVKAFHLAELQRHGIPVPEALVLPPGSARIAEEVVLWALGGCVAVYPSPITEAPDRSSCAGRCPPILNVRTVAGLAAAIGQVRAFFRAGDPACTRSGIIFQRMIPGDCTGVLLTIDPGTGGQSLVVVESCRWPALAPAQVERLVETGRRIEKLLGSPQQVEWAFVGDQLYIAQTDGICHPG